MSVGVVYHRLKTRGGSRMSPAEAATKVELANDADLQAAARAALRRAGVTREELERQAAESRFSSERARQAWFVVSSIAEGS